MSVGGSPQKGNQNSAQSGVYSGVTDGTNNTVTNQNGTSTTSGTQTGQTSGTQTGTQSGQTAGQTAGQNTVNTTAGWDTISQLLQGMVSGAGGITPTQQVAMDNITSGAQGTGNTIDYAGKVLSQYVGNNHDPYQIADAGKIIAPTGAAFMDAYTAPVEGVIASTANDLTQGYKKALNEISARYGGAMGNGREGVAAAGATDDFLRTLDNSASNLRLGGYNTAVGAGQGDAGRQLQANTSNVDNGIRVNQFNTQQKNINDAQSIGVVNDYVNQQLAKNNIWSDANKTRADISQTGVGNILSYLTSQNPAFGNSSTGSQTGTQSGTSTGTSSGTSSGTTNSNTQTTLESIVNSIMHGSSSGASSGTSSGSSSSKGGGVNIPIF